jgi:protein TonB
MRGITTTRIMASAALSGLLAANALAQRVWLDQGLAPGTKGRAAFYLEPGTAHGDHRDARIFLTDGTLKAEGSYADAAFRVPDGSFTFYHPNGKIESQGLYRNGRKQGVWKRFDARGSELAEKIYDNSLMDAMLFTMAQTMPAFPGGEKALVRYLKEEVGKVPHDALANFTVEKDGRLAEVEVSGVQDGALKEKIAVAFNSSPRWTAGVQDGQPVRVRMRVPLN